MRVDGRLAVPSRRAGGQAGFPGRFSLTPGHYGKVFGIRGLPRLEKPVVVLAGTVSMPPMAGEKTTTVSTVFGKVIVRSGRLATAPDQDVVIINRHRSTPGRFDWVRLRRGSPRFRPPDIVPYEAIAAAIGALDPKAVVTMHAEGADPGKLNRLLRRFPRLSKAVATRRIGELSVVKDILPGTAPGVSLFPAKVVDRIQELGYIEPNIVHAGRPRERIAGARLQRLALNAIKAAGSRFSAPIVVQTQMGPTFETRMQVADGIARGASAFAMTHVQELDAITQALKARGSKAELISFGLNANYPEGVGGGRARRCRQGRFRKPGACKQVPAPAHWRNLPQHLR